MLAVVAVLLVTGAGPAWSQPRDPLRPHLDWRTVETAGFIVHYPRAAAEWTLPLVARMEAMRAEVEGLVGFTPERRTTVIVADPYNVANGLAVPLLDGPVTVLWTTPPEPRTGVDEHRDWGEILFVHEYAHLAHLAWPSRNPRERAIWSLLPVRFGPIARRSPTWVVEGYATYIEGRLTGTGRPFGTHRPAFLRLRALEGRLPTYGGLAGGSGYMDAAAVYLVGSAYLEWLVARGGGEESWNHVWRRLSAWRRRSFGEAFAGVFGGPPDELYGRFTVELTEQALAAGAALEAAGLESGELFQLRRWGTGDPSISPDGRWMAIELGARGAPPRLVVWSLEEEAEEPADTAAAEAARRLLERDPLDVPAIPWHPPPRTAVATLHPVGGRAHRHPRFLPGGREVLVVRSEPLPDGTLRPDLFVWDFSTGSVRRVTRGAGIRVADPSPDGLTAAGVRCNWGICDLVRVDLRTGEVRLLLSGAPDVVHYRPRFSPDGRTIIAAVQAGGRWRLVSVPAEGGAARYLDPDDGAQRYDATFLPNGDAVVAVSTLGGIADLERIDLVTGEVRPLTRVVGAVAAPEPNPRDGRIYFLEMHSRGWDVRRLHPDEVEPGAVVLLPPGLWPIATADPAEPPPPPEPTPIPPDRPYGWGHQRAALFPAGSYGADGGAAILALATSDPIGRLATVLQAAYGDPAIWSGVGLGLRSRRLPVDLTADAFLARQHPSGERAASGLLDVRYTGGSFAVEAQRIGTADFQRARLGASGGLLDGPAFDAAGRFLVIGEIATALRQTRLRRFAQQDLTMRLAAGRTHASRWTRWAADVGLRAGSGALALEARAAHGRTLGDAAGFESFLVGGSPNLLFDPSLLPQRIPMPGLPVGTLAGDRFLSARFGLSLGLLNSYFWAATTDPDRHDWMRVLGLERTYRVPAIPYARVPTSSLAAGVSHSLDAPFERRTRAYVWVGLRP